MEVGYQEEHITNQRGLELFTCRWLPTSPPKALVFLLHGYAVECSEFMGGCGMRIAAAGYAVFGLDCEGHGKSAGPRCYIRNFDLIAEDYEVFYKSICEKEEYKEKRRFLYGESMGGAVALLLHRRDPTFWDGAVLIAPMCKISEKVKPHPIFMNMLSKVAECIPRWKIVPTKDIIDSAFKDLTKREKIRKNKLVYQDKPRLRTATELLKTSLNLEENLNEVTLPLLVLQGEEDMVNDPEASRSLYERADSADKTMKLYPGMWHNLTVGEPDDNQEIVYTDILQWLDERSSSCYENVKRGPPRPSPSPPAVANSSLLSENLPESGLRRQQRGRPLSGWMGRPHHHDSV